MDFISLIRRFKQSLKISLMRRDLCPVVLRLGASGGQIAIRVNRFYFTDTDDSYSATWDDYSSMGVIAVEVFDELKQNRKRQEISGSSSGRASKQVKPTESRAGTGMGEDSWSPSRRVSFKPRKHPIKKKYIEYEWRSTLCSEHIVSCSDEYPDYHDISKFWSSGDWVYRHEYAPRRW